MPIHRRPNRTQYGPSPATTTDSLLCSVAAVIAYPGGGDRSVPDMTSICPLEPRRDRRREERERGGW